MNWRKFVESDYPVIAEWFIEHGWEAAPDISVLSTIGIVVQDDNGPQAVGFLYLTNSPMGFFEWIATNPKCKESLKALRVLMEAITVTCKNSGVHRLVHFAGSKTKKLFKKLGFSEMETATLMLWRSE